jgi:4-amino-4-deoxy-L-arabinose transferase-like glycosyltransferase
MGNVVPDCGSLAARFVLLSPLHREAMDIPSVPHAAPRQENGPPPSPLLQIWTALRTNFFWIVIVALAVRVLVIFAFHTYRFPPWQQHFTFGYEMGRIGQSIAQGKGFGNIYSNIYHGSTGPTSWEPPLYPYLVGGVFRIFGIYTPLSAIVLLTINSVFSAVTCVPIFLISRRCFGEKVAVASAWTWALYPWVIYWCTTWVWETSLSTLLLATLFWLGLTMEERQGLKSWIQFGLLWGAAALSNTSLVSFLPVSGLWAAYGCTKRNKRWLVGAVIASLIFLGCLAPWQVRNYRTFGRFIFVNGDFGAVLRMGNGPGANGTWMDELMPSRNPIEFDKFSHMGEVAYTAGQGRQAMQFIRANPGRFVVLCMKRFLYYWGGNPRSSLLQKAALKNLFVITTSLLCFCGLGLALRKRAPGAWLFFWLLLFYPVVYYITISNIRYRQPLEPFMVILSVFLIEQAASNANLRSALGIPSRRLVPSDTRKSFC